VQPTAEPVKLKNILLQQRPGQVQRRRQQKVPIEEALLQRRTVGWRERYGRNGERDERRRGERRARPPRLAPAVRSRLWGETPELATARAARDDQRHGGGGECEIDIGRSDAKGRDEQRRRRADTGELPGHRTASMGGVQSMIAW
jgi:hypothetical protein